MRHVDYGRQVLKVEAEAVSSLMSKLDDSFDRAVEMILGCRGRVVCTGMGKTGIIAQKVSATLASTGTPSLFLHPAEAAHGDLGRVVKNDLVLALSNSGETEELVRLLPYIRRIGARIISIVSSHQSTLGRESDVAIELGPITEACPLGLAPSASTTAMLALGDALTLCVLKQRNFNKEEFSFYHPGGELGRKLLRVCDVFRVGENNPIIRASATVREGLETITRARGGAVSVVDDSGKLVGIFTDGDLRRGMLRDPQLLEKKLEQVMTRNPIIIHRNSLAAEAVRILKENKVDELPVIDDIGAPVGMLDVQDLLDVGLV
jgi:arabinose-5-phosphate isomerase